MSEQDLRRTFQVDSHNQVPEYEVLKLQVNPNEDGILMKLSTFGKDFKLRLKRNVDFQQRIKDMKIFMAESTKDGQLRYTEIKSHHQAAPPSSSSSSSSSTSNNPSQSSSSNQSQNQNLNSNNQNYNHNQNNKDQPSHQPSISGFTYHDENNLAALLIDHDRRTGQLQVDGTIGNDFVIKPMPQATIDALILKGQQDLIKSQAAAAAAAAAAEQLATASRLQDDKQLTPTINSNSSPPNISSNTPSSSSTSSSTFPQTNNSPLIDLERSATKNSNNNKSQQFNLEHAAIHMHDDDPHDDDEMFLDEDEAIELAHLQSAVSMNDFNHTITKSGSSSSSSNNNPFNGATQQINGHQSMAAAIASHLNNNKQHTSLPQPRALSKSASERKWKKYRKLMAQTQVPKPGAVQARNKNELENQQQQQQQQTNKQSSSSSSTSRARRHTNVDNISNEQLGVVTNNDNVDNHQLNNEQFGFPTNTNSFQVAHHIVYRQKPSSEGSSSEHRHSFMISPQDYSPASMDQLVSSFSPQRLMQKRSVNNNDNNNYNDDDNMIENQTGNAPIDIVERLARRQAAASGSTNKDGTPYALREEEEDLDADFLHDPMGGQFYLEPGSVTGFERAGYSDWSLINDNNSRSHRNIAPPPYALNNTVNADSSLSNYTTTSTNTNSTERIHLNRRYKRHVQSRDHHHQQHHRMGNIRSSASSSQVRRKRQAPDTVWPEVLLVVDYDSFLLHGGDSRDVKRYFVSFWNGVDLRYKLLIHPRIRISLAGMIVAKDRDATPYLERNRLRAPNADAVDAAGALTDMGKYLYREDRLPTYDLAVVITKLDMCRRRYEGGRCNRGTAGFAYVGGACVVNKRLEKVNSVAIIEDSGGFSGIIVAAHEVGHLLGCVHDGSPPPSYLGGPGATHCPWEDGYIMSDLRHTERGFKWSQCSVEQFKHFLNGETATCLYNYPHESQMLHRLLPGTMLSLDEQCKRDRGTNACFKDARVCAQLFCFDSASGYCVSYRPAAEGSPCGEGQVCRNGKCVGEIENIIPDYTHQLQTVVARRPSSHASSVSRLADNGLSASSTSTATSSPDNKLPPVSVSANSPTSQFTSRMDTFPIDTPLNRPTSTTTATSGNNIVSTTSNTKPFPPTSSSSSTTNSASTSAAANAASYSPYGGRLMRGIRRQDNYGLFFPSRQQSSQQQQQHHNQQQHQPQHYQFQQHATGMSSTSLPRLKYQNSLIY